MAFPVIERYLAEEVRSFRNVIIFPGLNSSGDLHFITDESYQKAQDM